MAKTVVLERKPLSFSERTYLPQIATGLKTTFSNMFKPKVTLQYPDEKPNIPQNYRGVPTLVKDPNGREKCVSCQLCEFVCPPKAIRITPGSVPEDEEEREHVEKNYVAPKVEALQVGDEEYSDDEQQHNEQQQHGQDLGDVQQHAEARATTKKTAATLRRRRRRACHRTLLAGDRAI